MSRLASLAALVVIGVVAAAAVSLSALGNTAVADVVWLGVPALLGVTAGAMLRRKLPQHAVLLLAIAQFLVLVSPFPLTPATRLAANAFFGSYLVLVILQPFVAGRAAARAGGPAI